MTFKSLKEPKRRGRTWSRGLCFFSFFTELESILFKWFPQQSNRWQMLHRRGAAWQPRCAARSWGVATPPRGRWQETLFLHFFPSRKKIVPLLCSRRLHLKWQAGENENKPFLGRHSTEKCILDKRVGKRISRIFWIGSTGAVKAIVLSPSSPSPDHFRMSLRTVQVLHLTLQIEPQREIKSLIQGKLGNWKLPLRVFHVLIHKRGQENTHTHTHCNIKL